MNALSPSVSRIEKQELEFQTLSHAGLRVRAGQTELLCDPWVVGSVYWRSWWNYPSVPRSLVDSLRPDFIYLTHLHWDHFQAASLRLFPDDVPILVPFDRYERMTRDLRAIGRKNVRELHHGERVVLGPGLALTSFHFSPIITDSAVVVELGDRVLLNANDAKFAGLPLRQILKRYPKVDFCFRSHSSANPRACHHFIDRPDAAVDDNEHYLRAFSLFMARVRPAFAIPFASNSCLLHDDVYEMNALTQTPLAVKSYFENFARARGLATEVRIMIPGDSWSETDGFRLCEHDYFSNREAHLRAYRRRVGPALAKQDRLEKRITVPMNILARYFARLSRKVPRLLLRPLVGREVLIVAKSGDHPGAFAVNLAAGTVRPVDQSQIDSFDMRIEFPAMILFQALTMNMFGHAGISKRVHFHAKSDAMPALKRFVMILEWEEAELFPIRANLNRRTLRALLPRWREGILYAQVLVDLLRGRDVIAIEDKYLSRA